MKPKFGNPPVTVWQIVLVAGILATSVAGQPVQWSVESGGNGHYYEAFYVPGGITWQQASNLATDRGGYLATPTNALENDFVYSLVSADNKFWFLDGSGDGIGPWLGGLQADGASEPGGGWQWVTGEAFEYTAWAPLEPNNNLVNENRLQFFGYRKLVDSTWNDYPDSPTPSKPSPTGYIVEWSTNPPPELSIRFSEVEVCWNSVTNATYTVECRSDLTSNLWVTLRDCVPSAGNETCIYDKILRGQPQRFYRVILTNCVSGP